MTDRMDINRVLTEMRSLRSQVSPFAGGGREAGLGGNEVAGLNGTGAEGKLGLRGLGQADNSSPKFSEMFERAVNGVNDTQQASAALAKSYEQGTPGVDITDVMIASQKAGVSFQAMVQVRNKLVEAYRDVMNMPI